jgi:hypothetical protein
MLISEWRAIMTPQKATLDSMRTPSWFVSYRRLSPQFQLSLSAVTLGIYLCDSHSTLIYRQLLPPPLPPPPSPSPNLILPCKLAGWFILGIAGGVDTGDYPLHSNKICKFS